MLSGGGIIGAAYEIGALARLEAELEGGTLGNLFDFFVGTSGGSFVATLLSQGIPARELYAASLARDPRLHLRPGDIHRFNPGKLLSSLGRLGVAVMATAAAHLRRGKFPPWIDLINRAYQFIPTGMLTIAPLEVSVRRILEARNLSNRFSGLARPLYIVAIDLDRAERIVFGENPGADPPISQAVAASSALPQLFGPVSIGDRRLVDGGVGGALHLDIEVIHGATQILLLSPVVPTCPPGSSAEWPFWSCRTFADAGLGLVMDQCQKIKHQNAVRSAVARLRSQKAQMSVLLHQPPQMEVFPDGLMDYGAHERVLRLGFRLMEEDLGRRAAEYREILGSSRERFPKPRRELEQSG